MKYLRISLAASVALLLMAGCGTTTVTNLTPKREFRNENGFYPIEAALNSSQQTLRWESIKGEVMVEKDVYTMHPTPLMTNRWETLIPVPPGNNVVSSALTQPRL